MMQKHACIDVTNLGTECINAGFHICVKVEFHICINAGYHSYPIEKELGKVVGLDAMWHLIFTI